MKKYVITEKLNKNHLVDIKLVLANQIEKFHDGLDAKTIKLSNSKVFGEYIFVVHNGKEIVLFSYNASTNQIFINDNFNEYRIFDLLEDHFGKDIVTNM
jgi:hypothetical protein